MNKIFRSLSFLCFAFIVSCNTVEKSSAPEKKYEEGTFGYDLDFLKQYQNDLVILGNDSSGAQVIISPDYQARVMTSTAKGRDGLSYGWVNHELIASGKLTEHMNAFGGEERFWVGPEGGQFSVFFKAGSKFDLQNWQTPAAIDIEKYSLVEKQSNKAIFSKEFELENYSGTKFKVSLTREISLLDQSQAEEKLGLSLKDIKWVGYETVNNLKNIGEADWDTSKGVLSIWLLGMMNASPKNTIIIPYKKGQANQVNDSYFGKISADRLIKTDSVLYLKADANSRGKIGVPPQAVIPIAGSYDSENKILTIIRFDYNGEKDYVNSMWEIQKFPYKGDVLNAYNDGKNNTGSQMGKFYELESSSPAVALKKDQTLRHTRYTFHFEGNESQLELLSKKLLGVNLKDLPVF